ncbi:hypothetical protein GCHA_2166 [Paraglaciecola chathamensis S18K6]|uniref:Uncharacterized protein n=2 Tax=Paraglaciecola chathamensis TaxID=368405 RepID=A0ABQ0I5Z0_9ALTE|nr:hypothetical protein GAGA_1891 [Paraglaciecola agarilytica NO2]GAC10116.1 hypothetical protein GCHA_2166 [Paraglaciecola chathamensis S18K6]
MSWLFLLQFLRGHYRPQAVINNMGRQFNKTEDALQTNPIA